MMTVEEQVKLRFWLVLSITSVQNFLITLISKVFISFVHLSLCIIDQKTRCNHRHASKNWSNPELRWSIWNEPQAHMHFEFE